MFSMFHDPMRWCALVYIVLSSSALVCYVLSLPLLLFLLLLLPPSPPPLFSTTTTTTTPLLVVNNNLCYDAYFAGYASTFNTIRISMLACCMWFSVSYTKHNQMHAIHTTPTVPYGQMFLFCLHGRIWRWTPETNNMSTLVASFVHTRSSSPYTFVCVHPYTYGVRLHASALAFETYVNAASESTANLKWGLFVSSIYELRRISWIRTFTSDCCDLHVGAHTNPTNRNQQTK